MKICAIVAEYDPFHNGHKYLLQRARQLSDADKMLVIMSGNFTQRGEAAVLDKYTRAKHAVLNGADAVIELPALFATAPAELFARGAVKILSSIPSVQALAFGCEDDDKTLFQDTAKMLTKEANGFKEKLKEKLKAGFSFIAARAQTVGELSGESIALIEKPNNILGVEYTKALQFFHSPIQPLPVKRIGGGFKDKKLQGELSSASAIREHIREADKRTVKLLRASLPDDVYADLSKVKQTNLKQLAVYSLHTKTPTDLKKIVGCNEGLENRFIALIKDTDDYDVLVNKMTSKRYTSSRLRRILLSSFLSFTQSDIEDALKSELYLKVLAVKKESSEELLSALHESPYPLVTRKKDVETLKKPALHCFEKDVHANDLYNFLTGERLNEYFTLFV